MEQLFSFSHKVDSLCIRNNLVVVIFNKPSNRRKELLDILQEELAKGNDEVVKEIESEIECGDIDGTLCDAIVKIYDLEDGTMIFTFEDQGITFIQTEIINNILFILGGYKLYRMNLYDDEYNMQYFDGDHEMNIPLHFLFTIENIVIGFSDGICEDTEILTTNHTTECNQKYINPYGPMIDILLWYAYKHESEYSDSYGVIHVFAKGIVKIVETLLTVYNYEVKDTIFSVGVPIVSATLTSCSNKIIIACKNGMLKCFTVKTWVIIWSMSSFSFEKLYCAPSNQYMIGCFNTFMYIISMDGDVISCLRGHQDKITSIGFSNDASMIVSGSKDKTVRIWKLQHHFQDNKVTEVESKFCHPQNWVFEMC